METIKVAPSELRTGDVLCGDNGEPFAFVRDPVTQPDGTVMVDALDFPDGNPFTEVEFLSGTDATIFRARIEPEPATWLEGAQGWTNAYRVIDRAELYGFVVPDEYADALRRYRESDYDGLLIDQQGDVAEAITGRGELSDQATEFLDLRAPAGFEFHWDAGELSLALSWEICAAEGNGCTEDERCEEHCEEEAGN